LFIIAELKKKPLWSTILHEPSTDPHFATALEARKTGNIGTRPQLELGKKVRSQKTVYSNVYMETQGGHFEHFLFIFRRPEIGNNLSISLTSYDIYFSNCGADSLSVGLAAQFSSPCRNKP
jgi:hypothetical protein